VIIDAVIKGIPKHNIVDQFAYFLIDSSEIVKLL
jgi:hypothetical protein